ncbi:MAG TPA: hypothetical protein VGD90_09955 [Sphingobacteriaceae bacterium]
MDKFKSEFLTTLRKARTGITFFTVVALILSLTFCGEKKEQQANQPEPSWEAEKAAMQALWTPPLAGTIPQGEEGDAIRYGRELISHTSKYLGPQGSVAAISNGMNCQNCHLDAGTKAWGNNYSAVYSTYPKYRARSGTQETMVKRINDCFERQLKRLPPG